MGKLALMMVSTTVLVMLATVVNGSDQSVIQRLIVRLEEPSAGDQPAADNCTLFKQIEVRKHIISIVVVVFYSLLHST